MMKGRIRMSRRYSLKTKIDALNEIDEHDGDVGRVADFWRFQRERCDGG